MDQESITYIILFVLVALVIKKLFLSNDKPVVKPKQSTEKQKKKKRVVDRENPTFYTAEEVSVHDKEDDLWLIIDDKVYDVTEYVDKHMGGLAIMKNAGRDSTEGFNGEQHPIKVRQILDEYYIGELKK
ncbi:hypothetical protein CYY_005943 [Polysphondylium violaceum]|uniref:Cytochrome b5 heme-binding domain-containing protein n=1 Tax=Polysphondylium violaceum TaxID=133409 RepID=A0A8J4PTG5_9MYCE|nr:hypothetical protein CYY_005943 [Polysphondylium violaceum]